MVVFKFLPRVEQRRALEKIEHRRVVHERALVAHERSDARLVVVFQKAELVVVRGVAGLLKVQRVQITAQGDLTAQILVEYLAHIVLVFQIEGTKHLAVRCGIDTVPPRETAVAAVDRFGEPDAVRVYGGDRRAGLQPEFHRNEGRHIAAEAVYQFSPHYKRRSIPDARGREQSRARCGCRPHRSCISCRVRGSRAPALQSPPLCRRQG